MSANPNQQPKKFSLEMWQVIIGVIGLILAALALVPKNPTQEVAQKPVASQVAPANNLPLFVKDIDGNPIQGVQIIVDSSVIPPDAFPLTNSDGYTSISLPDGVRKIRVEARKFGYGTKDKNIDLNIKLNTNRTIVMIRQIQGKG
jgi:hypothetical protein